MPTIFCFRGIFCLFICFAAGVSPCFAGPIIYDLTSDWSDAVNPNGVWTYRGGNNVLTHFSNWAINNGAPPGQDAWAPGSTTPPGFIPAWMKVSSIISLLSDGTAVGDIVTHTFDNFNGASGYAESNVIWTAPSAGTADITGDLWQARNLDGRNQQWTLLVNGVDTATGTFTGGTASPVTKGNPSTFSDLGVSIFAGEVVELQIATSAGAGNFVGVNEHIVFTPGAATVPEPATFTLFGIGGIAFAFGWNRHRLKYGSR